MLVNAGPERAAIVSGEVVDVREYNKKEGVQGVVKIMRVHSGPKSLEGLACFDYTADEAFNPTGLAIPLLKTGELGFGYSELTSTAALGVSLTVTARTRRRTTPGE